MPKKKLTKAQVNKKVKTIVNAIYDLFNDKLVYAGDSLVPMSVNKLLEVHKVFARLMKPAFFRRR